MYLYICVYTYIYIHTYIHTYIHGYVHLGPLQASWSWMPASGCRNCGPPVKPCGDLGVAYIAVPTEVKIYEGISMFIRSNRYCNDLIQEDGNRSISISTTVIETTSCLCEPEFRLLPSSRNLKTATATTGSFNRPPADSFQGTSHFLFPNL